MVLVNQGKCEQKVSKTEFLKIAAFCQGRTIILKFKLKKYTIKLIKIN